MAEILKGFEVIDIEKKNTAATVTITPTKLRFNKATAQELTYPEYVVMSLNPQTHQVAIQGSSEGTKNAFLFAAEGLATTYAITVDILALTNSIRKMMGWADDLEYMARGLYYAAADAILFDMDTAAPSEKKTRTRRKAESESTVEVEQKVVEQQTAEQQADKQQADKQHVAESQTTEPLASVEESSDVLEGEVSSEPDQATTTGIILKKRGRPKRTV